MMAGTALHMVLELSRAEHSEDPYAFSFAPQDYLLRKAGGGYERTSLAWDEALLSDLDAVRRPACDPVVPQRLGETLRRFLTPLGWGELAAQIDETARKGQRVYLTLRLAAAELYALPWELATLKASGQHVAELPGVLLRYEWPETAPRVEQPTPRRGAGRILFAWSAAAGAVPAAEHGQAIAAACAEGCVPFDPARDVLADTSLARLAEVLAAAKKDNQPIAVLHLLCHGASASSTIGLSLNGEDGGESASIVDAGQLRQLLGPHADMVRLVVLAACQSGDTGAPGNQLGSVAQALHRAGIAAVVASRYPLSVTGSVRLCASLYRTLLRGPDSLEAALLTARSTLAEDAASKDWASLQLYTRAADGDDTRPVVFRPYQGLSAFGREQRRFYFGRQALVDKLRQRGQEIFAPASAARLLAILGPSGSGKSSVARAGLLAELESHPPPGLQPLRSAILRPGAHPREALERALADLPSVSPEPPLLLLVDQFEEIYTLCSDTAERNAFVDWLLEAATAKDRRVAVVLTLRSDFFGETQRHHRTLNQLIAAQHELIPGMTDAELRQAIAEPARAAGRPLDDNTVALVLAEARGSEGALPLVEFTLARIWEGILCGKEPGAMLREIGGIGGALSDQAKKVYAGLGAREQTIAKRALLRLVKLGEGTRDTRRCAPVAELCGRGETEADVLAVLRQLSNESVRLLTLRSDGAANVAEVTHEALFENWSELRKWIDESRADRRFHDRLVEAAQLWDEDRSRSGRLWRPPDLDLLRAFAARNADDLSPLHAAFYEASERAEQLALTEKQQRARLLRAGLLGVSALLIIAIIIAAFALRERRHAEQRELDMQVETGRQLLVAINRPIEALLRLVQAKERGSRSPILSDLLPDASRPFDAVKLVFRGHSDQVVSARYSADGKHILTGSYDQTARIFDATTGEILTTMRGHAGLVHSACYSPDGSRVVTGGEDRTARIFDAKSGQELAMLTGHALGVHSVGYSPDGSRLATGSFDGTARIWDVKTGQPILILRGHDSAINGVAYSPDGSRLATSSIDGTARVWDTNSGAQLLLLRGHRDRVASVTYSPDGRHILTSGTDRTARIFDAGTGAQLVVLQGHTSFLFAANYSPDGSHIVTASYDQTARIFDAHSGEALDILQGHSLPVITASYSPDGSRIVTGSADFSARVWDSKPGRMLTALKGHTAAVFGAGYSPDGRRVVTASQDGSVRIFDVASALGIATLKGHTAAVFAANYSPDGRRVVTASADQTARTWDAATGQPLQSLKGHSQSVTSASFSPDGRRIVTSSHDQTARIWDAATGQLVAIIQEPATWVLCASFSPDGHRIVTSGNNDQTARVYDATSGQLLVTLRGHSAAVASASYSPDGRRIVTASHDQTARVFDASSGQLLITLPEHGREVMSAKYSPDGSRILTASLDRTARIWDSQTGLELIRLHGHAGPLRAASYSPDGRRVVTAGVDQHVRIWDVSPETRTTAELARLIRCRSLLRLEDGLLVRATPDEASCQISGSVVKLLPGFARDDGVVPERKSTWNVLGMDFQTRPGLGGAEQFQNERQRR